MADFRDTRADRLATALDDFIRSSPDVEAAAVVSFDGLTMASALPDDLEEDRLGAMSAALLSLGEQAAMGLGRGALNQVFVEGEHGFVFLMSAKDQAVLAAIARRTAKIGFMLYEMRRAAENIGGILAPEAPADAAAHEFASLSEPEQPQAEQPQPERAQPEPAASQSEPAPSWGAPTPPPAPGGWSDDDTSELFASHGRDEPSQTASDAAWSS